PGKPGTPCCAESYYARMFFSFQPFHCERTITMMRILIACLIIAAAAPAQAQGKSSQKPPVTPSQPSATQSNPSAPTLKKPEERPAEVAPTQPVITVRGLCQAETGPAAKSAVPSTK